MSQNKPIYNIGDQVEIVAGEYAGLGGQIVAIFADQGYEVLAGGYRLPVQLADLAPELRMAARKALAELQRLQGDPQVITLLVAALDYRHR